MIWIILNFIHILPHSFSKFRSLKSHVLRNFGSLSGHFWYFLLNLKRCFRHEGIRLNQVNKLVGSIAKHVLNLNSHLFRYYLLFFIYSLSFFCCFSNLDNSAVVPKNTALLVTLVVLLVTFSASRSFIFF